MDHVMFFQSLFPEIKTAFGHSKTRFGDLLGAPAPGMYPVAPGKEREDGTRRTDFIAEIKMIRFRIVEVNGLFHQALPQHAGIKFVVPTGIPRNCGYVMDT